MDATSDTNGVDAAEKGPAPVTPAGRRAPVSKKAPARKRAAAKKAPAKKQAPAKKAPAKKAAAKKAPAKKQAAPAKKAAAKRAPAKRAATTRAPGQPASERTVPTTHPPEHAAPEPRLQVVPDVDEGRARPGRWAICAAFTEELLNDLVAVMIGEGVALEPLDTAVALPGMGEVDVRLALTITGGTFRLRADDGGRARVIVTADGDVSSRSVAYDVAPEAADTTPSGMPTPPAPIPVRVEALVTPFVELRDDHRVSIGLDLADAELVSLSVDDEAPTPEGVDPTAWSGMLGVFQMMFGVLGSGLFDSLGEHVGSAGTELPAEVGDVLIGLGVEPGRAEVSIASGLVTIGLRAGPEVTGRAVPAPVGGRAVGIGLASPVVDGLSQLLLGQVAGGMPLPFELEVDLGEQRVAGRLRQSRLLPDSFPDLRSSLRTEVRTRLVRGQLELSVQSAYIELPPIVPSFVNLVSRRMGDLVALAPARFRFPPTMSLPVPDLPDGLPVRIDDLRVDPDGVGVVVALV